MAQYMLLVYEEEVDEAGQVERDQAVPWFLELHRSLREAGLLVGVKALRATETATAVPLPLAAVDRLTIGAACGPEGLLGLVHRRSPTPGSLEEYARRLRVPLRTIAGCGHLPIGERPEVCLTAIGHFVASLD